MARTCNQSASPIGVFSEQPQRVLKLALSIPKLLMEFKQPTTASNDKSVQFTIDGFMACYP